MTVDIEELIQRDLAGVVGIGGGDRDAHIVLDEVDEVALCGARVGGPMFKGQPPAGFRECEKCSAIFDANWTSF